MIQVRHKKRMKSEGALILSPPQLALLPRSDAGSDGVKPAPCSLYRTIEKAKQKYCNESIIENKSNSGKMWKIVNELVNLKPSKQIDINQLSNKTGDVITNPAAISENLKAYFANIGKKRQRSIPKSIRKILTQQRRQA